MYFFSDFTNTQYFKSIKKREVIYRGSANFLTVYSKYLHRPENETNVNCRYACRIFIQVKGYFTKRETPAFVDREAFYLHLERSQLCEVR